MGDNRVICSTSLASCGWEHSPHRLVVRTSRCGRDNPGSTPGEDILFCVRLYAIRWGRIAARALSGCRDLLHVTYTKSTDSATFRIHDRLVNLCSSVHPAIENRGQGQRDRVVKVMD